MDEYIERAAVLAKGVPIPGFFCNMISAWDVAHLPAVNAEPVRYGEWIPVAGKEGAVICSKCGATAKKQHNFCPECGAKMEKR